MNADPGAHRVPRRALCVWRERSGAFSETECFIFQVFTRQLEAVLENRRLVERLQAANAELRATQVQLVENALAADAG